MKTSELNELIKTKTPNQILQKYVWGEISLTLAQIDKVNKLKDGAEQGHGGFNTKKISEWRKKGKNESSINTRTI